MNMSCRAILMILFTAILTSAADYFPIAVGNEWQYTINIAGLTGTQKLTVSDKSVVDNDTVFHVDVTIFTTNHDDSITGYIVTNGNDVLTFDSLHQQKPYVKAFEHQPVSGHTWSGPNSDTYEIVEYGSLTVAAGTFSSCYATEVNGFTSQIFAPDVGVVAYVIDGSILIELASYTTVSSKLTEYPRVRRNDGYAVDGNSAHYTIVNAQGRRMARDTDAHGMRGRNVAPGICFIRNESDVQRVMKRVAGLWSGALHYSR